MKNRRHETDFQKERIGLLRVCTHGVLNQQVNLVCVEEDTRRERAWG